MSSSRGRDAPDELVEYADLVTEMREIKHPFAEKGIKAQPGIGVLAAFALRWAQGEREYKQA